MSELRWILVFLGLLVVGVVYFLGRRGSAARDDTRGLGRFEPQFDDSQAASVGGPGSGMRSIDHQPLGSDPNHSPPSGGFTPEPLGKADSAPSSLPGFEWTPDEGRASLSDGPGSEQKIFTLRLVSRDLQGFGGAQVFRVLRDEDLRYGKFEIFHRLYKNSDDDFVFSVASLTEPGSFDLDTLENTRLRGLSFFMVLPGPQDGGGAFTDMLATARRVAERLNGALQDQTGSTLSAQRAGTLRDEVIQYQYQAGLSQLSENH